MDLALALETDSGALEELGLQTLLVGKVSSLQEVSAVIDSVSSNDVNGILQKGKLSMASFGKISKVPHLDELK